jgi:hypothetical protein
MAAKRQAKNPAAVALGKRRWAAISAADRSEHMAELGHRRAKKLSAKRRSEIAAIAGRANSGKPRKAGAGRPKKEPEK